MRSIQLHVPSLAIGLAACGVVFVTMSQGAPQISPPRVSYGPHPRDYVQIKEGTPFVVPTGTVFALTALGTADASTGRISLRVNGSVEVERMLSADTSLGMNSEPTGFAVLAGNTITVDDTDVSDQNARAWGYLSR